MCNIMVVYHRKFKGMGVMNGNNYNNGYNGGNQGGGYNNNYNNQNRSYPNPGYPNGNNGRMPNGSYYRNPNGGKKPGGNGPLIAAVSILGALLVAIIVFIILWLTGIVGSSRQEEAAPTQTEQTIPAEPQTVTMFVANVEHSIYFRSSPAELDSNIVCEIPLATQVAFIENTDAVFAKIKYNGQEGYVKREYLSATQPQPKTSGSSGDTTIKYNMYVVNVKNSIYLRSEPVENSSNIICEIPLGSEVGFIERTNGTFMKIYYQGKYGYSKAEYLSSSPPYYGGSVYMTVCNVKTSIYLRKQPVEDSSNIICEIPVNSTVEFLGNANGTFYKIRWNGREGYAKSEYLR